MLLSQLTTKQTIMVKYVVFGHLATTECNKILKVSDLAMEDGSMTSYIFRAEDQYGKVYLGYINMTSKGGNLQLKY